MALTQLSEWLLAPYSKNSGEKGCKNSFNASHLSNVACTLHRRMLVISGNDNFCEAAMSHIYSIIDEVSFINVASFSGSTLKGKKRQHVLGSECDIAILDCRDAFRPGDVMAVAGIIKRGGCLILVCPDFDEWVENVAVSFISEGFTLTRSRYLTRFIKALRKSAYVAFHTKEKNVLPDLAAYRVEQSLKKHTRKNTLFKTEEQQNAYQSMYQAFSVNKLNALLTAPRGRGKSSLLGILIDSLVSEGKNVLVTSAQASNVTNLMARLNQSEGEAQALPPLFASFDEQRKTPLAHKATSIGFVKWVPPDSELLHCDNNTSFDLVVVDEAASIPLPVVTRIMNHNAQWVLSTTLQGYEGSGSGFLHKLIPNLPETIDHVTLRTPLRWFDCDPIETFLNKTCLFEGEYLKDVANVSHSGNHGKSSNAELELENSEDLITACSFNIGSFESINETTLQQVMSLLALAHYQTTPDDFMRLLDSPDVLVATLKINDMVVAAAIMNIEGGNSLSALSRDIASGLRRPKGHLGAQRLTLLSAAPKTATHQYWRINRIAVNPELQAKGLGSYLFQKLKEVAHKYAIDALCTSYGTTSKLDNFWSSNGFYIVDYGRKPNKASGETSALAILPLTQSTSELTANLIALRANINSTAKLYELPQTVLLTYASKLAHFTQGTRSLDDVWPILCKLACELQAAQNLGQRNSSTPNYSHLSTEFSAQIALINRLVKIIDTKGYLKTIFNGEEMEIENIKALLKNYELKISGLKELTALIRTAFQPAFDTLKK